MASNGIPTVALGVALGWCVAGPVGGHHVNAAGFGGAPGPELVSNGSFEAGGPLAGWSKTLASNGRLELRNDGAALMPSSPHYLRVKTTGTPPVKILNSRSALVVARDAVYELTALMRQSGSGPAYVMVRLQDRQGRQITWARIEGIRDTWSLHRALLRPSRSDAGGQLAMTVDGPAGAAVDLDLVSLKERRVR
jgi:hypothetical protein